MAAPASTPAPPPSPALDADVDDVLSGSTDATTAMKGELVKYLHMSCVADILQEKVDPLLKAWRRVTKQTTLKEPDLIKEAMDNGAPKIVPYFEQPLIKWLEKELALFADSESPVPPLALLLACDLLLCKTIDLLGPHLDAKAALGVAFVAAARTGWTSPLTQLLQYIDITTSRELFAMCEDLNDTSKVAKAFNIEGPHLKTIVKQVHMFVKLDESSNGLVFLELPDTMEFPIIRGPGDIIAMFEKPPTKAAAGPLYIMERNSNKVGTRAHGRDVLLKMSKDKTFRARYVRRSFEVPVWAGLFGNRRLQ